MYFLAVGDVVHLCGKSLCFMVFGRQTNLCTHQYVGNVSCATSIATNQQFDSQFMRNDIHRQFYSGIISQKTRRNTLSRFVCRGVEHPSMVSGTEYNVTSETYSWKTQHTSRPVFQIEQTNSNRMVSGSIGIQSHISDLRETNDRSVCDSFQSQVTNVCVTGSGQQSIFSGCNVTQLERTPCICVSSISTSSCSAGQDSISPMQDCLNSFTVATQNMVFRSITTTDLTTNTTSLNSKSIDTIKRKVSTSKHSNVRSSRLGIIKQSVRDKRFSEEVAEFVSQSRRPSTRKVYDAKWRIFTGWCRTKQIDPVTAPINVVADFLLHLFQVKKCQISTIKGYRSTISNTLKFKTGRIIGSHPVISELIKSFELQRPIQRSLTPKWNLPWVLQSLCDSPFEPLSKASRLHVTMKTVFLLSLATAKRTSEIHAFASDSEHLRFNKVDGSVSLTFQTGFLAKNQIPLICPDPVLVPNLAKTCNRENKDRLLCPIRALKFYLKMTSSYRNSRTKLFLPIRGNHNISKTSISRWISYTVKLAYRKLTRRDISFLKIRAHELRAFSSSWAYINKAPLDDILRAAVWNQQSTFARFNLRDMFTQIQGLQLLGPIVVAQKVVGGHEVSACHQ